MTPERWRRIEELFHEARERAPDDQEAFLDAACGSDSDLHRDVASLLDQSEPVLFREGVHALATAVAPHPSRPDHQGRQLGPYLLGPLIGAGGMGDVYRAHDAKLGRDVAVKILPAALADHPDRLARSEREARILAALNHPNIGAIYGIAEGDGVRGLVLELVEGVTLKEKLDATPTLPLDEALSIARQIAGALEAAHQKGIVHRDLKPANVKITPAGVVKVLDFGLAKIEQTEGSSPAALPVLATSDGVVLGTVAYMSPEQARALPVDKRADIWAFGCVLYEMLAGVRAFAGESAADVLGRITGHQPDWDQLPADLPARVRYVLHRCLTKDPSRRFHDVADARIDLEEGEGLPPEAVGTGTRRRAALVSWLIAAALAGVVAVALWLATSRPPADRAPVRVAVPLPSDVALFNIGRGSSVAVSPDGGRIVYSGVAGGRRRLYMRALDGLESVPIAGTEGATSPFFSPDGRWIAFIDNPPAGSLMKVSAEGGTPLVLVDSRRDGLGAFAVPGAAWADDDSIVFAAANPTRRGVWRVSSEGGIPERLTAVRPGEFIHSWPQLLTASNAVLYTVWNNTGFGGASVVAERLGTGERTVLAEGGSYGRVVSPDGRRAWLVYARAEVMHAAPFDLRALRVTGTSVPVVEGVAVNMSGGAHFSIAANGLLAYVEGGNDEPNKTAFWIARDGTATEIGRIPGLGFAYRLSPDGRRLARPQATGPNRDLWIEDLERRGTPIRLTVGVDVQALAWTPDGRRIIYSAGSPPNLFWVAADGNGREERLTTSPYAQGAEWVSPDGELVAYTQSGDGEGADIWLLSLRDRQARPLQITRFPEIAAAISPDSRWIAYQSSASGRFEVYVKSLTSDGPQIPVSSGGGARPLWSRDGRELYYRSPNTTSIGNMVAVSVDTTGGTVTASTPRVLFHSPYQGDGDIAPDGRFLLLQRTPDESPSRVIQLVMNWFEELQRKVPQ
jgi:Tol biopolymer transport system component